MEALEQACKVVGNKLTMAKLLDVGPSAITGWIKRGRIPATHVLKIERASGISRHQLRPDLYPIESKTKKKN